MPAQWSSWKKQWRPSEGNDEKFLEKTAQETLCAHLDSMTQRTGIAALDDTPSVWQTNWTFASIMPGPHLTTAGKLWLKLMLQDVSGRVEARMGEKVALELSSHTNKKTSYTHSKRAMQCSQRSFQ